LKRVGRFLNSHPRYSPLTSLLHQKYEGFTKNAVYDPKPTLTRVKCPVLALNGDKDLQVPPDKNLPGVAEALEAGGNTDYQIVKLPKLNHLFQTCESGSPSEYAQDR
jgi:pimeloyl-ACP methyl ester carboxylesterase